MSEKAKSESKQFLVRGRVQGVGFRWFVEREAQMLGIRGWVRNNLDGAVEVLAIGTREQLLTLRGKLQRRPARGTRGRCRGVRGNGSNGCEDISNRRSMVAQWPELERRK